MTWSRYGRGGWNNLGPMIAMMAASAASEWEDNERRSRRNRSWHDGQKRRKRRGRMFGSGELRLALLALIEKEPRHGYELIRAIEDMTGGAYAPSPGAVYPTLQMLEEEGQIKPAKAKAKDEDGETSGKKPFKATKSGKAELEERADEVEELMGRLGEHGERAERVKEKSPDLFRAMGNLANVLKNRAKAGKLDQNTINEIVDIIDEVAKRIERL
ncbi:PadR family transcriptional regulator [Erythrobacter sp. THAF29]|uniref:PadR family transcriptional regulator n=1 Tax=Erythrobacter sp. THAF29 TaxID=2587851 RepID=UPI0012A83B96|nr:PadR family transcriptional regulator [Erythrobacter sp. THAF29]QFT77102.1 Transcriptional regulator YqjI [Erythrobacter sp. THAF29]